MLMLACPKRSETTLGWMPASISRSHREENTMHPIRYALALALTALLTQPVDRLNDVALAWRREIAA